MNDVVSQILLGGLLGLIGQGIRVIIGLKKMKEKQQENKSRIERIPGSEYETKRLLVSIFIGFVAGALGILFAVNPSKLDKQTYATLIAIGYSGVDFIEGFMSKYWSTK
jgi:uncharacterized membrane protein YfcA